MKDEVFFDEQGVKVTNTQLIVSGKSHDISTITSFGTDEKKPKRLGPIILIIVSLFIFAIMKIFALILLIIGIIWLVQQKKIYYFEYDNPDTGEIIFKIENKDRDFIDRLYEAINKAHDYNFNEKDDYEDIDEQSNDVEENEVVDQKELDDFYDELMTQINAIDINSSIKKQEDTTTVANELLSFVTENITTNCGFSVDQKCQLLEAFNKKMLVQVVPKFYNDFFKRVILSSYKMFDVMEPNLGLMDFAHSYKEILKQIEEKQPISFQDGFAELFGFGGLIGSKDGKFSMEQDVLNNYDLPKYREDIK